MEKQAQSNQKQSAVLGRENNLSFFAVVSGLLSDLPERAQAIAKKRFGLTEAKPQTLEKIGQDYGITRERVRQIVADAVKKVSQKKNDPSFKKAEEKIIFTIEANSGIIKEAEIIDKLSHGDYKEANSLIFLRSCSDLILLAEEEGISKAWVLSEKDVEKAKEIGAIAQEVLKKKKNLLADKEIAKEIRESGHDLSEERILDYLDVLSGIKKNKFEKWGIADWVEVNPKGTRERIYAVLKEKRKPLHFTEIAQLIDEYELGKKKAHVQTIHNELIKNDRFVLIGRGIYALKEWGYARGTIREVLEEILKRSRKSLSKEEILREVSKVRQVKKATILINLGNGKLFVKQNNLYSIKKN